MGDTGKAKKELKAKADGDYTVEDYIPPEFTEDEKRQLAELDKLLRELGLK